MHGVQRLDDVAPHVEGHHAERLVGGRPPHAAAGEEIDEAGIGSETARAAGPRASAAPGTVEPPGLAHQGKAQRRIAGAVKASEVEAGQLGRREPVRPMIVVAVSVAGEAGLDAAALPRPIEREADRVRGAGSAGGGDGEAGNQQGGAEGEQSKHCRSPSQSRRQGLPVRPKRASKTWQR